MKFDKGAFVLANLPPDPATLGIVLYRLSGIEDRFPKSYQIALLDGKGRGQIMILPSGLIQPAPPRTVLKSHAEFTNPRFLEKGDFCIVYTDLTDNRLDGLAIIISPIMRRGHPKNLDAFYTVVHLEGPGQGFIAEVPLRCVKLAPREVVINANYHQESDNG